ncbi:hypothetical protein NDU88_013030 [Pleurodeles waltl]|uniref:Uncharacterized protein n=1 Tax=Pleurodeles waltl TaxID=8319 RepID=A0AAV7R5K7_PLEWA|nr:hypothetical protein NDU88_013030 [Pleurodeles waltl]
MLALAARALDKVSIALHTLTGAASLRSATRPGLVTALLLAERRAGLTGAQVSPAHSHRLRMGEDEWDKLRASHQSAGRLTVKRSRIGWRSVSMLQSEMISRISSPPRACVQP